MKFESWILACLKFESWISGPFRGLNLESLTPLFKGPRSSKGRWVNLIRIPIGIHWYGIATSILVVRPVKTDFMFYISSRVRFSPKSGKNCTNFCFAIFLAVFQFSKFLMNMLSPSVLFCSFSNQCVGVCVTRSLTTREFSLIVLDRFQGKIAQTWDFDEKAGAIVVLLCNSLRARASV